MVGCKELARATWWLEKPEQDTVDSSSEQHVNIYHSAPSFKEHLYVNTQSKKITHNQGQSGI